MTGLEEAIARLEEATTEAREMARELHSATKAARSAERDLDTARKRCCEEIPRLVDEYMAETMKEGLEAWDKAVRDAIEASVEKVHTLFSQHMNMALHGNAQGRGPSVLDEVRVLLELGRDALAANASTDWAATLPDLRRPRP